jgi:hypothetical protein
MGRSQRLEHSLNVRGMDRNHPFPSQEIFEREPHELQPGSIEKVNMTVGPAGMDQRGRRIDNQAKVQSIPWPFETMLGGGHDVHDNSRK